MLRRFTDRARLILRLAQVAAEEQEAERVMTDHLLVALLREWGGVGGAALRNMEVVEDRVLVECRSFEAEEAATAIPPGLPRVSATLLRVLERTIDEAHRIHHNYVGTEHLLLALLQERRSRACRSLSPLVASLEDVRTEVLSILGHFPPDAAL